MDYVLHTHLPPGLSQLGSSPKQLFIAGCPPSDWGRCAAVVGSRRMTDYGRKVIERLVPGLVSQGFTVVSGLMYGVDAAAHLTTLGCGGKTIAVLGWGIEDQMSTYYLRIVEKILASGGAVVSEWQHQQAARWTFPHRDRLMAAMAEDVYVVEAAEKSGSLITAQWALKLKKKLWAVPGPVTSPVSEATNRLIAEGKATAWREFLAHNNHVISDSDLSSNHADIYRLLAIDTYSLDELACALQRPVHEVGGDVQLLLLGGKIKEREGRYYVG